MTKSRLFPRQTTKWKHKRRFNTASDTTGLSLHISSPVIQPNNCPMQTDSRLPDFAGTKLRGKDSPVTSPLSPFLVSSQFSLYYFKQKFRWQVVTNDRIPAASQLQKVDPSQPLSPLPTTRFSPLLYSGTQVLAPSDSKKLGGLHATQNGDLFPLKLRPCTDETHRDGKSSRKKAKQWAIQPQTSRHRIQRGTTDTTIPIPTPHTLLIFCEIWYKYGNNLIHIYSSHEGTPS